LWGVFEAAQSATFDDVINPDPKKLAFDIRNLSFQLNHIMGWLKAKFPNEWSDLDGG